MKGPSPAGKANGWISEAARRSVTNPQSSGSCSSINAAVGSDSITVPPRLADNRRVNQGSAATPENPFTCRRCPYLVHRLHPGRMVTKRAQGSTPAEARSREGAQVAGKPRPAPLEKRPPRTHVRPQPPCRRDPAQTSRIGRLPAAASGIRREETPYDSPHEPVETSLTQAGRCPQPKISLYNGRPPSTQRSRRTQRGSMESQKSAPLRL